jgi:hypothetical protein
MSGSAVEKAIELVKKATDADQDQKYEEALREEARPLYVSTNTPSTTSFML